MSNLMSSTELLEIGTFCYRLNTTRSKPLNWLLTVNKAKKAEKLQKGGELQVTCWFLQSTISIQDF